MKKKSISKLSLVLLCAALMSIFFPVTACADMGPKASVNINFENMGDTLCYGTLLSSTETTGPASVWNGEEEFARYKEKTDYGLEYDIWKKFVEYEDSDGYYFLQEGWLVSETKQITWGYYPPHSFKILLYYPKTDTFVESGIYEKYAFDTYYTVDMTDTEINSVEYDKKLSTNERINAYRSYNYTLELLSLAVRIVLTILIETAVGLIFGFRKKNEILLIFTVNTLTQVILNVLLNIINYNEGQMAYTFFYIVLEIAVFALEAAVYCGLLKKNSDKPKKTAFYVIYSLVANAISFGSGLLISHLIPGIF